MWGMAQEMGLDFVDLDMVGVDFTAVATIPETTARHHNVIVIADEDGTPVVAASNPTDVFAMDDLRTIIGRGFNVVVATRARSRSYIGRAFNSGGDAADMAMEASLGFDGTEADGGPRRHPGRHRRGPDRPLRQPALLQASTNERRTSTLSRRRRAPHPLSDRWVLHDVSTAPRPCRGHHPPQGHGGHERRRAPHPPGRPDLAQRRQQGHRPADGDATHDQRREGRHAGSRQVERRTWASPTSDSTRISSRNTSTSYTKPYGTSW